MSFEFDGVNNHIASTSNRPSSSGNWTLTFWIKRTADFSGLRAPFRLGISGDSTAHDLMVNDPSWSTTYQLSLQVNYATTQARSSPYQLPLNEWAFISIVGSNGYVTLAYWDGTSMVEDTVTQTNFNSTYVHFGAIYGTSPFQGRIAHIRQWNAQLTSTEIIAEKNSTVAVRTTNLIHDHSGLGGNIATALAGETGATFTNHGGTGTTYSTDTPTIEPPPDPDDPNTPFAAENTQVFLTLDTIKVLRVGIKATQGPNSAALRLEYRVSGGTWAAVGSSGAIVLADSTHIDAGGEPTFARLTAPSGLTTSDFVTGRVQDDENPADAVGFGPNQYTELAWAIKAQSPATDGQAYEFRVTLNGTPIDTYTATPILVVGASFRNGTLNKTLGAVTLASAGTVVTPNVNGSASITLGATTLVATGEPTALAGTLAKTLDNTTLAAAGEAAIEGTLAKTLGNATLVAAGEAPALNGVLVSTLGNVTLQATAAPTPLSAQAAIGLADSTLESAGDVSIEGSLASTLDDVTLAGTGVSTIEGTTAATLGDATLAAAAESTIEGFTEATLDDVTLDATGGAAPVMSTADIALGDATLAAAATSTIEGNAAIDLDDAALVATAAPAPTEGVASITLGDVTLAAAAEPAAMFGQADVDLGDATLEAAGLVETDQFVQEGFRFYHDDGDEDEATAWGSQDVGITVPVETNIHLRTLIRSSGYVNPKQFKLQYRKVGTTEWEDVA